MGASRPADEAAVRSLGGATVVTITAARVAEVCSALADAGAGWAEVARQLPEFERLHRGRPAGRGVVRPWVLLAGQHESYDTPVRLVRYENGRWFIKGTYMREVER